MNKYIDDIWKKHRTNREPSHGDAWVSKVDFDAAIREAMEEQKRLDNQWHPWPEERPEPLKRVLRNERYTNTDTVG